MSYRICPVMFEPQTCWLQVSFDLIGCLSHSAPALTSEKNCYQRGRVKVKEGELSPSPPPARAFKRWGQRSSLQTHRWGEQRRRADWISVPGLRKTVPGRNVAATLIYLLTSLLIIIVSLSIFILRFSIFILRSSLPCAFFLSLNFGKMSSFLCPVFI